MLSPSASLALTMLESLVQVPNSRFGLVMLSVGKAFAPVVMLMVYHSLHAYPSLTAISNDSAPLEALSPPTKNESSRLSIVWKYQSPASTPFQPIETLPLLSIILVVKVPSMPLSYPIPKLVVPLVQF